MSTTSLEGRTAVVTGAGAGLGRAEALALAAAGANVVVNDMGPAAEEVVSEIKELGVGAVAVLGDVSDWSMGDRLVSAAVESFGSLDIVVNNAGITRDTMLFNLTEAQWDDVIAVHLKGQYCTIKPASILMRQQRYGRIINFSSTSGTIGNTGQFNYGAAKSAIAGMTRVVAKDLGRYGVTCNYIGPGASTRMTATVSEQSRELRSRAGIAGFWDAPLPVSEPP